MKGGQIQASGLDHPVGWPRSHVAVATNGCVPVVYEIEAQRLAPIMTLQVNVMMRGGPDPSLPDGVPDAWGRVVRNVAGLHRGAKMPTDFDRE